MGGQELRWCCVDVMHGREYVVPILGARNGKGARDLFRRYYTDHLWVVCIIE